MYFNLDWQITIGDYQLALLESCEVHSSVDLLADTCVITLPGGVYKKALTPDQAEQEKARKEGREPELKIKRGDKVVVNLGYNKTLVEEFNGYLLRIDTDGDSIALVCEDALFLMRKPVKDKQFKTASVAAIAQYLIDETGINAVLAESTGITYEKFVIRQATGYDVLKKLQEETGGNIYMRWLEDSKKWQLNIHPPYIEKHGAVRYSFQRNIESSDLKYVVARDKRLEVTVERIGKDGKVVKEQFGTTGGDSITLKRGAMDAGSAAQTAKNEYLKRMTDGYEGSITTWLIPAVAPGFSAEVVDEDYPYKDGTYYVTAVTTTFSASGGERKVQLGIKVGGANG